MKFQIIEQVINSETTQKHASFSEYPFSSKTFCGADHTKKQGWEINKEVRTLKRTEAISLTNCESCKRKMYSLKYKIVSCSNFDDELVSDVLLADNVPHYYAKTMVKALQEEHGRHDSTYWFKIVPLDYRLHEREA